MLNYLKRRFSSNDLHSELDDKNSETNTNFTNSTNKSSSVTMNRKQYQTMGPSPSLPVSPSVSRNFSFTDSFMNVARNIMSTSSTTPSNPTATSFNGHSTINKTKKKTLLVIDDQHVDWNTYFTKRKLSNDYEMHVEQAEFKDINLVAYSDSGTMVDVDVVRNGNRLIRSYRPDFVLIRQNITDTNSDWKSILIGLQYGLIPSVNSLSSVYNFADRTWVFSELIKINRKLGNDKFPLIKQVYYPNYKQMLSSSLFPCVIKSGTCHQGLGKVKAENFYVFQDVSSIISVGDTYSTTEPYVDCKYDIRVQKIGENYKAFMRKSITGNWKANTGSAILEQIPITPRYKLWVDEVSKIFHGLDICAVQAIVDQDTKEHIIDANGCSFNLLGETQEEDRQHIADLVTAKMIDCLIEPVESLNSTNSSMDTSVHHDSLINTLNSTKTKSTSISPSPTLAPSDKETNNNFVSSYSNQQLSSSSNKQLMRPQATSKLEHTKDSNRNESNPGKVVYSSTTTNTKPSKLQRAPYQQQSSLYNSSSPKLTNQKSYTLKNTQETHTAKHIDDADDTMTHLRKSFAGIFGEMMS